MAIKAKRKSQKEEPSEARPAKKSKFSPTEAGGSNGFASILSQGKTEDFERGGGTTLNPLEVKEARAEGLAELRKTKQRKSFKNSKTDHKKSKAKETVNVARLSYKHLNLGTRTMSRIVSIRPLELIVSLPNQLYGHIPATSISSHFTKALAELAAEESDDESDDEAKEIPSLDDMFEVGEYVTAVVANIKTADASRRALSGPRKADEEYRMSRRVELSLDPVKLHEGLTKKDLVPGLSLSAAVQSIEDNGYVLDLGVQGVTAFVSNADVAKALPDDDLMLGQIVRCRIAKLSGNGRTCAVAITSSQDDFILTEPPSLSALLPDNLVSALVTAIVPQGLNVKLFGLFDGTIDLLHLKNHQKDIAKSFKIGQKLKARLIWSAGETVALSLLRHVVKGDHDTVDSIKESFPVGRTLDAVRVARVESEYGITCTIPGPTEDDPVVPAFVHLSKISDEHIESVFAAKEGFDVGSFHRARVIGFAAFEGIVQLSFQKKVLDHKFLKVADVVIGEAIKATVRSLTKDGLFLDVDGNVNGIVWPEHYSDIKLKHPEKRFKEGSIVKARIFSTDPGRHRVTLTLKKSLLTSDLPVISSFDDAASGQDLDAVVKKITDSGILVESFGGVQAFVPIAELSEEYFKDAKDIKEHFDLSQTVQIRILKVDHEQRRIVASVRRALHDRPTPSHTAPTKAATGEALTSASVGATKTGKVVAIHDKQFVLSLEGSSTTGLLASSAVASHHKVDAKKAHSVYNIGDSVEVAILSVNTQRNLAFLGFPKDHQTTRQPESISSILTFDKLEVGQEVQGTLGLRKAASVIVSLGRGLSGRLHFTDAADDYSQVEDTLSSESALAFKILDVDRDLKHVDITCRPSVLSGSKDVKDPLFEGATDLEVYVGTDRQVRGFVVGIAAAGLFVSLSRDLTARVKIKELFDDFVQDWKAKFQLGQLVSGRIISIDEEEDQVEMSLRSKAAKTAAKSVSISSFSVGQRVSVVIKSITAFGVFLRVQGSSISGLCHRSEVLDDSDNKAWNKDLPVGEERDAVVTEVNPEKNRISFSLKPSKLGLISTQVSEESDQDDDDAESLVIPLEADESESEDEADVTITETAPVTLEAIPAKPLAVGSTFGAIATNKRQREEDESSDEDKAPKTKTPKTTLQAKDKTGDLQTAQPSSVADFERLLLSEPNSSLLWISYIALHASTSDLAAARKTAKRALDTINFRELDEKKNVWVAWLNLENQYGSDAEFDAVFQDAIMANEPKAIHLTACDLLAASGKFDRAQELHEITLKKFAESSKIWTLFAAFLFGSSKGEEARGLLARALKALPKRKHVKTIAKFAALEFKMGDPEVGRTLFQGILDNQPKRLDMLSVYIDLEARAGNFANARSLFKRALDRKLPTKKAKWLFKKYLNFEEEHGTPATQAAVKHLAAEFVAAQQAGQHEAADD